MGLALVAMLRDMEEEFNIEILDQEQETVETPGALIDLICRKASVFEKGVCPSLWGFNRIRRACTETGYVSRKAFTLDLPFDTWIPRFRRSKTWRHLTSSSEFPNWPEREPPGWVNYMILFAALILPSIALCAAPNIPTPWNFVVLCPVFLLILLGTVFAACGLSYAADRVFNHHVVPARAATPRRLLEGFLQITAAATEAQQQELRKRVAEVVKRNIVEVQQIPEEYYREDAHFYKDLGLG